MANGKASTWAVVALAGIAMLGTITQAILDKDGDHTKAIVKTSHKNDQRFVDINKAIEKIDTELDRRYQGAKEQWQLITDMRIAMARHHGTRTVPVAPATPLMDSRGGKRQPIRASRPLSDFLELTDEQIEQRAAKLFER